MHQKPTLLTQYLPRHTASKRYCTRSASSTTLPCRLEFLPNRLATVRSGNQVRAPAPAHLTGGSSPRHGDTTPARTCSRRNLMKAVVAVLLVFALAICAVLPSPAFAEPR